MLLPTMYSNLQVEKRIDAFLTDDYLQGKPLFPMIDETLDGFSIPKAKQQRLKMLTGDIKRKSISRSFYIHTVG